MRGFSDGHALKLPNGRPVFYQPDTLNPDGYELPFHLDTHTTSAAAVADTSHAWSVQHRSGAAQVASGRVRTKVHRLVCPREAA